MAAVETNRHVLEPSSINAKEQETDLEMRLVDTLANHLEDFTNRLSSLAIANFQQKAAIVVTGARPVRNAGFHVEADERVIARNRRP